MTADLLTDQELADIRSETIRCRCEGRSEQYQRDDTTVGVDTPVMLRLLDTVAALRADRDTLLDALTNLLVASHSGVVSFEAAAAGREAIGRVRSHTGKDPA